MTADRSAAPNQAADSKPDDSKPDDSKPDDSKPDDSNPGGRADRSAPGKDVLGQGAPDQAKQGAGTQEENKPEVFRSPMAALIWWLWLLFATGNLIDLAVQGRDHASVVAAVVLVLITGVFYAAAQRPRIIAADSGLTVKNPIRNHEISWAAIDRIDLVDLIRVHCDWRDGSADQHKVFYAWAVHASRRRQVTAQMRASRQNRRPGQSSRSGSVFGAQSRGIGFSAPAPRPAAGYATAQPPKPLPGEADQVLKKLTARLDDANDAVPASAPASAWYWPAIMAIVVPALAVVIATLT